MDLLGLGSSTVVINRPNCCSQDPCFKYQPSRPRYCPISPFLPAVDTILENICHIVYSKKRPILKYRSINSPILADKSPDISPYMK